MHIFRTNWNSALFLTEIRQVTKTAWRNNLISGAFSLKVYIQNMQNQTNLKSDVVTWLKIHQPAFNKRVQSKMTRVPWIDSSKWPYWEKILCMGTADKVEVATFAIDETTILDIRAMIALTFWSRLTDKVDVRKETYQKELAW